MAIVLPTFAIVACIVIVGIALYIIGRKCRKKQEENAEPAETDNGGKKELEWEKDDGNDVERQRIPEATAPRKGPVQDQLDEAFVVGVLEEEVPFDVPLSPPGSPIPKYDAKTY
mmetsp:Transcript_6496/g.16047  ORF Transcript_6496/g.16047 Transcript_6496/m.16047 type:complete len:114 (+) Transcript_6496:3-344(+)